jgi:hypothetical protein
LVLLVTVFDSMVKSELLLLAVLDVAFCGRLLATALPLPTIGRVSATARGSVSGSVTPAVIAEGSELLFGVPLEAIEAAD